MEIQNKIIQYKYLHLLEKQKPNKTITDKVKLINWYVAKTNDKGLEFLVCKAKSLNTCYNFYFRNYNYYILKLSEKNKVKKVLDFIDRYKFGEYKILTNFKEIYSKNYSAIYSIDSIYCDKIKDEIDKVTDVILIKTLDLLDTEDFEIEQRFNNVWFYVYYNIQIGGCYDLKNLNVTELPVNENYRIIHNYFIEDDNIESFFTNYSDNEIINLNLLSFDLECETINMRFPDSKINPITHIGVDYYNKDFKYSFCLINTYNIPNIQEIQSIEYAEYYYIIDINSEIYNILTDGKIWKFMSEQNLLQVIKYLIESPLIDYILSYNGNIFDFPYIDDRLEYHNLEKLMIRDYFMNEKLEIKEKKLNYSGFSDSFKIIMNSKNQILYDLFNYVKKNYEIDNYSLNCFSQMIFKDKFSVEQTEGKIKLQPINKNLLFYILLRTSNYCFINNEPYIISDKSEIISNYSQIHNKEEITNSLDKPFYIIPYGNSTKIFPTKIIDVSLSKDAVEFDMDTFKDYNLDKAMNYAKYCLNDTILCRMIFEKENIHFKVTSLSNTYYLPQYKSFIYKSSTNCLGILLKTLLQEKLVIIKSPSITIGKYSGGKVYEPKKKYILNPVLTFDFQSLYPNIIILHNISPETIYAIFRTNKTFERELVLEKFKKYSPSEFELCIIDNDDYSLLILIDKRKKGLIPKILEQGLKVRLEYKKMLKETKDDNLKNLYDSMQYTIKIFINSIYGLLGSMYFIFSCKFCAQACTAFSREKLEFIHAVLNRSYIKDGYWFPNKVKHIYFDKKVNESYPLNNFKLLNVKKRIFLNIIYGDTDSNMIEVEEKDIKICCVIGFDLFKILNTEILFNTILFEFENIYTYMMILKKKKYTCISLDPNIILNLSLEEIENNLDKYTKPLYKGINIVRRDYPKILKEYHNECINYIRDLLKQNITNIDSKLILLIRTIITQILSKYIENENILDYVYTRKYKKLALSYDNFTHEKIKEYNSRPTTTEKIENGDRYSFVYVVDYKKKNNFNENDVLKILDWNGMKNGRQEINSMMYIINPENPTLPPNKRISLENYIFRFLSDIKNYLQNIDNINKLINLYFKNE